MSNQLQEQASVLWNKTPISKRITIIALVLVAIVVIGLLIGWANKPSFSVAYSGLSDDDAAAIVSLLDEQGIDYQLKGTGTIYVESDKVYSIRLSMASEGLPESSSDGYELFDSNTLGMNEFTQKVNYQRALEGELERTISSLDAVESVSVHIVTPEDSLLTSDQNPTTASVVIKEKSRGYLDSSTVKSIANLVAFSVEGLTPENVVIVDANNNELVSFSGNKDDDMASDSDNQRAAEIAAASEIQSKVENLLDSILGPDRAAVQANVVMDWSQKEITSNMYDPTQTVLRNAQTINEGYGGAAENEGGIAGASSNLPTAVATVVSTSTSSDYYRNEQTMSYEVSQIQTHEVYSPGQIQKISLAVMVDEVTDTSQLDMIKEAVSAAAGIDTTRGDTVSVNTMTFDRAYVEEQALVDEEDAKTNLYTKIGVGVGAGLLIIILFIYFSKVMKNIRMASKAAWKPILMPVSAASLKEGILISDKHSDIPENEQVHASLTEATKRTESKESNSGKHAFPEDEQRAHIISRLTEESPATVAEIIQIWLAEDEKNRG